MQRVKYQYIYNKPKKPNGLVYYIAIILYECYIN